MAVLRGLLTGSDRWKWFIAGVLLLAWFYRMATFYGWDESFYMSQMISLFQDHDLSLQNNLMVFPNELPERYRALTIILPRGAIHNCFSIGPAIVHGLYSLPVISSSQPSAFLNLRRFISIGNMVILILTIIALEYILRQFNLSRNLSRPVSALAVIVSPLMVYGTRFYLNSHLLSASFSTFSLFGVILWLNRRRWVYAILTGLSLGLLAISRWQEITWFIVLMPVILYYFKTNGHSSDEFRTGIRTAFFNLMPGLAAFLSVVFVQAAAWKIQFDQWLVMPQGSDFMLWSDPELIPLIFSSYHGVLPWSPGFVLGLLYLPAAIHRTPQKHMKSILWGGLFYCAVSLYVSACAHDWWAGSSYGPRRLSALLPFTAVGLGYLLTRLSTWRRVFLISALCIWAVFTASAFRKNIDDLSLLFQNRSSEFNMRSPRTYLDSENESIWSLWLTGFEKFTKPAYTLVDAPHTADRWIGLSIVLFAELLCMVGWRYVAANSRLQWAVLSVIWIWITGVGIWLACFIPRNAPSDAFWLSVVSRTNNPDFQEPLPKNMVHAARFIQTVDLAYRRQFPKADRLYRSIPENLRANINLEEIHRFAVEQDFEKALDRPESQAVRQSILQLEP
ncbi:hypothetical protein JXA40_10580 [bacterium]|nr:hypothetical protein [candidate division CSSED10-310 bacterium]